VQKVADIEDISAPLVRRYIEYRRSTPTPRGTPLDSSTLHGYVRAIRAWLFWAASEELIDEKVPKRIALPKKEQKVLQVLSDEQVARLFREAARTATLLLLLLTRHCRHSVP
jgi:site-specific recombinase XerD